jgi:AcrR family transcriptional regulator
METTHREIVAAAIHAFRVRGYAATKMTTIAAIAGVSPRTLYRYYGSKSELFAATVEESIAKFLQQLSELIHTLPLREAIITAIKDADIELNGESREMMRLAAADEKVWRYFLGASHRVQTTLAAALRVTTASEGATEPSDEELLLWDVRASALIGAITTAYRRWATVPDSELSALIATAVDDVLPVVSAAHRHSVPTDAFPMRSHSGIQLH